LIFLLRQPSPGAPRPIINFTECKAQNKEFRLAISTMCCVCSAGIELKGGEAIRRSALIKLSIKSK
jgi:hypothetical protein